MNELTCPICGGRIPESAPAGLCPRCLLAANVEQASDQLDTQTSAAKGEAQEQSSPAGVRVRYFGDYELMTGRPPFRGSSSLETLIQVREQDAIAPRQIDSKTDLELQAICLKCLEKNPDHRYGSAEELAEDLDRWLVDEPVLARPPSAVYKFQKAFRRNKLMFGAGTAVAIALVAGLCLAAIGWRQTGIERDKARHLLYSANMNLAGQAWEQGDVGRVRGLLEETKEFPNRGFEWYYWQRQTHLDLKTFRGHIASVDAVAFSPDGQRIVTGSADNTAKVWEAATPIQVAAWQAEEQAAEQRLAQLRAAEAKEKEERKWR